MKLASKPKSSLASSLLAAMTASTGLFAVSSVSADTLYWDGTGASWSVASGWSTASGASTPDPVAAPGASDDVVFNVSSLITAQAISLGTGNQAANSLTFSSSGTVNLNGTGSTGGNRDLTIGAGGITLASGAGNVTIGNAASNTNVFARLGASQTWTNNSTSTLTSRNNTSGIATGTVPVTLTLSATSSGNITNTGALNDGAQGAVVSLVVNSSGTGISSNGGGNYSGGTTVLSGILTASGSTPLGASGGAVLLGDTSGTALATLNIGSTSAVSNNITVRAGSSGIKTIGASVNSILDGTLALNDGLTFSSTSAITINGAVSGTGAITKANTGVLTLAGNNTFSGGVVMSTNSILRVNNGGTSATNSAIGTGTLSSVGSFTLDNTSGAEVTLATNNAVTLNGNLNFAGANSLNLGTGAFSLGTAAGSSRNITSAANTLTIGGVISNGTTAIGISKQGVGTLRLANTANTYTGSTSFGASGVVGGVLEVTSLKNGGVASSIGASSNATSSLVFGGATSAGTLRYIGSGDSTDRRFQIGGIGANIESSGTGALNFTNTGSPAYSSPTSAGSLSFGGTNTDANTFAGAIVNPGSNITSVTKNGVGRWIFSGANTYTGVTTINAGTLQLGASDRISNSSNLVLGGGTFATGGFNETLNTLSVSANSVIDFGSGASALVFSDSSGVSWGTSVSLSLLNFTEGLDTLRFGTNSNGLTSTQLGQISINGLAAAIDANGFITTAVPEPSSFGALAGAAGLLTVLARRRRRSA